VQEKLKSTEKKVYGEEEVPSDDDVSSESMPKVFDICSASKGGEF